MAAGQTEATATKTRFKVNQGVMFRAWITFPAGCHSLVNVRLSHDGHPFLPVDKGSFITGNDYTYVYPVMLEITDEPAIIEVESWNTDDTFPHTIDIQLLIIDKIWIQGIGQTAAIVEGLKSLFSQR